MLDSQLLNYSSGYLKNYIFSNLYLGLGINVCKPVTISALLTWRCNARCSMCDHWSRKEHNEISSNDWIGFLTELKKWYKNAHVQFSGGEPFVRNDSIEIFEHCASLGLSYGITSNLAKAPYGGIERLIAAGPFNINVSLDGATAEIHDQSRGIQGFYERVIRNLDEILSEISRQNKKVRVIIKTVVSKLNLDQLDDIVILAKDKGVVGVNFQPVFKWSEASEELLVKDLEKVERISHKLAEMKRNGFPILSPERDILSWKSHFGKETVKEQARGKCIVGIKNFDILPTGDVFLCRQIQCKIGNISETKPSEIWNSDIADHERSRILKCNRLCLNTCQTKRSIKEMFFAFLKMAQSKQGR